MAISLLSIQIKHERRLRLTFTDTLAAGAFGSSPTLYTVTTQDSLGSSPTVTESILIASDPRSLELALGDDLVPGGLYLVTAIGVPSIAGPVTDSTSQQLIQFSLTQTTLNAEPAVNEQDLALYGEDMIWNGLDYQETRQGDLDLVVGVPNALGALQRRCEASGLPWDATYGPNAESFVNSADAGPLRGAIVQQLLRDDRVKSATVDTKKITDGIVFVAKPTLIGEDTITPIALAVP